MGWVKRKKVIQIPYSHAKVVFFFSNDSSAEKMKDFEIVNDFTL